MARILIIDDDAQEREFLHHVLESAGHEVVEAAEGGQALRAYRDRPADLVLCDIFMPGKEGLETIRELRALRPDVRIIAVSGGSPNLAVDYLFVARKLGALKALDKPLRPQALLDAVTEVLQTPLAGEGDAGE
jgi:CheY-like chemotaxis protein